MTDRHLPRTLTRWIERHPGIIETAFQEDDGAFEDERPDGLSYWIYLKPGWRAETFDYRHGIHEPTVKRCLEALKQIVPCDCDDCCRTTED